MRWPLTVWCWLFAPTPRPFQPPPGADARIARGAYQVEVPGHCGACHTPRSFTLQEKALSSSDGTVYLSGGGAVDGWIPPSLRDEHGGGKHDPEWGLQDRETGKNTRHHGDAARARHRADMQRAFVGHIQRPSVLRPQHPCDEQ